MSPRAFLILAVVGMCCSGMSSGCMRMETLPSEAIPTIHKGIYHKVRAGETIWKIAQTYGVTIEEIIQSNRIPDVAQIEENQLIFIPGAIAPKEIISALEPASSEFIWPVKGKIISYFGTSGGARVKTGIDIASQEGQKVLAARDGKVVFADYLNGYAYCVILDHGDGYFTVYSHNSVLLVNNDDVVARGMPIAKTGRRGDLAFVHFEVRKNEKAKNPLHYLP